MTRTLELEFENQLGRSFTITLDSPPQNLTGATVKPVMDLIIAKNIFRTSGGDLVRAAGARIITKEVTELVLF